MLTSLAPVVSACRERLSRALEMASAALTREDAEQLERASRRSIAAIRALEATLAGRVHVEHVPSETETCGRMPKLSETAARQVLTELNEVIRDIEHGVLVPAERELTGEQLLHLKRLVGRSWGWIISDLQDPLWQQYPETAP